MFLFGTVAFSNVNLYSTLYILETVYQVPYPLPTLSPQKKKKIYLNFGWICYEIIN